MSSDVLARDLQISPREASLICADVLQLAQYRFFRRFYFPNISWWWWWCGWGVAPGGEADLSISLPHSRLPKVQNWNERNRKRMRKEPRIEKRRRRKLLERGGERNIESNLRPYCQHSCNLPAGFFPFSLVLFC